MKHLKNILFLLCSLIISCEQIVEIDLPDYEPQITLSCYYQLNDIGIEARLTDSHSILNSDYINGISGATIQLYENDQLFVTFINGSNNGYGHPINEPLQAGNRYEITVDAEGFESVSAIQMMPNAPVFELVNYTNGSNIIIDGRKQDIYEIALQDEVGVDNYYEFNIYIYQKNSPNALWSHRHVRSRNPYLETVKTSMYLKDDAFDGETYHIELLTNRQDTTFFDVKVEVVGITRDKYFFVKTILAYNNIQGNPFAEPVIVHTNVENGQGIFSLQNSTEWIIE